ncbi:MerR family transcriptional regulator [Alcanivorax quisquiliarum]|uniref:Helix-turn-helix domain-containing protein n=1 Tax=Alcanivorax quisquiliarum TaxID=2933565 RepID=A0ABT0E5Y2_9GAMM|nr:helix-turn-helix domain-containing protein [Alcanivorax quisquiliarum]MCK0537229.1 helix-turn-helix domain-containing protein [Alcanivorax quisquiliarum]
MSALSIGQLARDTGCKVQTIRYYEEIGLLPPAARSAGNQRRYSQAQLRRLRFILHSRELGFAIADIRQLLELADQPQQPCAEVDALAERHRANVRQRITRLRAMEQELTRMLQHHQHGEIRECRVIDVLADHALCSTVHAPAPGLAPGDDDEHNAINPAESR